MVHLADPNPALLALMAVLSIVVAILAVLYVREVTANGKAAEAAAESNRIEQEARSHD